jgi:hypothetical protein
VLYFLAFDGWWHVLSFFVIVATDCILAIFVVVVASGIVKATIFEIVKSVFVEFSILLFYLVIRNCFEFLFIFVFSIIAFLLLMFFVIVFFRL